MVRKKSTWIYPRSTTYANAFDAYLIASLKRYVNFLNFFHMDHPSLMEWSLVEEKTVHTISYPFFYCKRRRSYKIIYIRFLGSIKHFLNQHIMKSKWNIFLFCVNHSVQISKLIIFEMWTEKLTQNRNILNSTVVINTLHHLEWSTFLQKSFLSIIVIKIRIFDNLQISILKIGTFLDDPDCNLIFYI